MAVSIRCNRSQIEELWNLLEFNFPFNPEWLYQQCLEHADMDYRYVLIQKSRIDELFSTNGMILTEEECYSFSDLIQEVISLISILLLRPHKKPRESIVLLAFLLPIGRALVTHDFLEGESFYKYTIRALHSLIELYPYELWTLLLEIVFGPFSDELPVF